MDGIYWCEHARPELPSAGLQSVDECAVWPVLKILTYSSSQELGLIEQFILKESWQRVCLSGQKKALKGVSINLCHKPFLEIIMENYVGLY